MANNPKSKLKLLYLKRILEEETDAEHGLTMPQIITSTAFRQSARAYIVTSRP